MAKTWFDRFGLQPIRPYSPSLLCSTPLRPARPDPHRRSAPVVELLHRWRSLLFVCSVRSTPHHRALSFMWRARAMRRAGATGDATSSLPCSPSADGSAPPLHMPVSRAAAEERIFDGPTRDGILLPSHCRLARPSLLPVGIAVRGVRPAAAHRAAKEDE
jgi:hypothetical protein